MNRAVFFGAPFDRTESDMPPDGGITPQGMPADDDPALGHGPGDPALGHGPGDPADCAERQQDAGGLANIVVSWHHRYPNARAGLVSSIHDPIRSPVLRCGPARRRGLRLHDGVLPHRPPVCSPASLSRAPIRPGSTRACTNGVDALRTLYGCTGAVSTYHIGDGDPDASGMTGTIDTLHEHIFRERFATRCRGRGGRRSRQWVGDFILGRLSQTGP